MIWSAITWLFKGPLSRALDTIDSKIDNDTERDKAKLAVLNTALQNQVAVFNSPVIYLVYAAAAPLVAWLWAVCIYSIFWCSDCAYPQPWTVAALPKPIDEWAGAMFAALFGGGFALLSVKAYRNGK